MSESSLFYPCWEIVDLSDDDQDIPQIEQLSRWVCNALSEEEALCFIQIGIQQGIFADDNPNLPEYLLFILYASQFDSIARWAAGRLGDLNLSQIQKERFMYWIVLAISSSETRNRISSLPS